MYILNLNFYFIFMKWMEEFEKIMTSGFINKINNSEPHKVRTLENIKFEVKVFNKKKQEDI